MNRLIMIATVLFALFVAMPAVAQADPCMEATSGECETGGGQTGGGGGGDEGGGGDSGWTYSVFADAVSVRPGYTHIYEFWPPTRTPEYEYVCAFHGYSEAGDPQWHCYDKFGGAYIVTRDRFFGWRVAQSITSGSLLGEELIERSLERGMGPYLPAPDYTPNPPGNC